MHPKKTVIVVGAGASQEAGLPTSVELKISIARDLDIRFKLVEQNSGDRTIAAALQSRFRDINPHLHACWKIRDALPQAISIDNFIESHRRDEKIGFCGKLAIVRSILVAEKRSLLYVDPSNTDNILKYMSLEKTWFNAFWQCISDNCQAEELRERFSSIALIVFNYDRCIEQYLYHSIRNYYGLSADSAASLVNAMEIYHPYGMVGSLPWGAGPTYMEFGGEPSTQHLVNLAEQIKTFTEGTNPEASDIIEIRRRVETADTLIFLGFAYHRQNLKLLEHPTDNKNNREGEIKCYGTAFGISEADLGVIESEITELLGPMQFCNLEGNLTCSELYNKYRRTFSFA